MESSFFEYRDETGVESDSDTEIIDDSLVEDSFSAKKKNKTVFVAESEESTTDETEDENIQPNESKIVPRKSIAADRAPSSDNDTSTRISARQSQESKESAESSSSDDEEYSPEVVPRRRLPMKEKSISSNDSIIVRKNKKRFLILESDTDNSIIIEHDKQRKLKCLKDTPVKIDDRAQNRVLDESMKADDSEVESEGEGVDDMSDRPSSKGGNGSDETDDDKTEEYEDGPDEDQMAMSRATRMSIMGVIPKDNESDDSSDFILSDDSSRKTRSIDSLTSGAVVPEEIAGTPETPAEFGDKDDSKITCSPFGSPLQDISGHLNESTNNIPKIPGHRAESPAVTFISETPNASRTHVHMTANKENFIHYDDDVTIIDTKPEIIALSSDDEDEEKPEKSPKVKKSPKPEKSPKMKPGDVATSRAKDNTIQQYLVPPSYPNQVVYVKKQVRENELSKLNGLKEDLNNIRNLLDNMDLNTLPDGGVKLVERLAGLEAQVRHQGDKVANMLVEPDNPTAEDIAKDGFEKGLSWEEIQKASNAVQPRMFGKQAMATHMAERSMILERLRDLHQALGSRPADSAHAPQPALVSTRLMPHQLHALAWLRWRETQRPPAGILADDMGLGKTITMIALIVCDKEQMLDEEDDDDESLGKGGAKLSKGGTLVVCPASLMQQWANEVGKHCPRHALSVSLHHGPARASAPHRLAAHDLVLTTYNILQRDNEKNGVLMRVLWRRVILDEAHTVRNHKAATSLAVAGLRARRRWCLTGTPVQNKDIDLYALLKFLKCSPFDDLAMWKKWIDNKSLGGQERLSTIMRCILLRRTKAQLQAKGQLACLPQRDTHLLHVTLTKPEMNVYQKVLVFSKTLFAQFLHQRAEKNSDAIGFTAPGKSEYDKMHKKMIALQGAKPVKSHEILVLLLRLRQVCCHCGLIASMLDAEGGEGVDPADNDLLAELNRLSIQDSRPGRKSTSEEVEEAEAGPEEGTTAAEAIRSVLSPNNPVFNLANMSSKIQAVMECLQDKVFSNKGEKAVVVSQWTSVLRLVEARLAAARVRCVTLSGAVPVPARAPLIAALNDAGSGVQVMLLSLCAGGVGLNLCGANHLLLLDPHWNPQLEEQAQDRIYRVGQEKQVHIYRFMCVDTVEQSIRKLQQAKLELAENVLTGAKNTASKLSIEDLKMLFNMGQ